MSESWVEKFRPNKLDEIESQDEIILSLKNCIISKNIPHILFFGPSGCGKTSTILALAKEIFGKKYWADRVIELNASDERGIKVIREKIKRYAMNSINDDINIPPWKIIILDEADNMTPDSQFALRKIMEEYSKYTRFCIICNYMNKIIDPIISRCSIYRFKPLPQKNICKRLKEICNIENTLISDENISLIENISRGDMRKAINLLQSCRNFKKFISNKDNLNTVTQNMIENISGLIPNYLLNELYDLCLEGKMDKVDEMINMFYLNSYSITVIIDKLIDITIYHKKLNDNQKALICKKILSIDNYLLNGCDEYIQYNYLAYGIYSIIHAK